MKTRYFVLAGIVFFLASMYFVSAVTVNSVSVYPKEIAPGEIAEISITIESSIASTL